MRSAPPQSYNKGKPRRRGGVALESFALTDIGSRREVNQDYVYCNDDAVGLLPNLYIVADGMGGHKAGDFASKYSVSEF